MKLVRMVRDTPTKGGAKVLNVPEGDVDKLKYQGWTVAGESAETQPADGNAQNGENPPKQEEPKAPAEAKPDTSAETKQEEKTETKSNGRGRKPMRDE